MTSPDQRRVAADEAADRGEVCEPFVGPLPVADLLGGGLLATDDQRHQLDERTAAEQTPPGGGRRSPRQYPAAYAADPGTDGA